MNTRQRRTNEARYPRGRWVQFLGRDANGEVVVAPVAAEFDGDPAELDLRKVYNLPGLAAEGLEGYNE